MSSSTDAAADATATQEKDDAQQPPPFSTVRLEIGDSCQVLWRDGSQRRLATIIERRLQKKRKGVSVAQQQQQPNDDNATMEYYVHYVNHDRRLDEWIDKSQFVLETLQKAPPLVNLAESEGRISRASAAAAAASARTNAHNGTTTTTSGSSGGGRGGSVNNEPAASTLSTSHANLRTSPPTTATTTATIADPTLAALEQEHEETTKVKNISKIYMGGWEVEAWYFSPYPDDYAQVDILYVCEYCLKYMLHSRTYKRHRSDCACRKPPGREIYRHDGVSVFEVDGREARVYCQNLCLLAKLFLDHKTLYYDVDPFLFYVICHVDEYGAHIVGYFSKEKVSDYNLACILCFPQYQKSGYGKFIISLSYELTKREHKTGSPEKPLSDLGKMAYRSYWTHILMNLLAQPDAKQLSIGKMSELTGIKTEDIISTLQSLDMIKCWKGQHVVHVKQEVLKEYLKQDKQFRLCNSEYLKWDPPAQRSKE